MLSSEIEPTSEPNPFLKRSVYLVGDFSDENAFKVTPQRFPGLFADDNDLSARYLQAKKQSPTTSLFTLIFSEKSNPLLQVLKIPATDVTLDQVGEAANLRIFPATEIVEIDKEDIPRIRIENNIGLTDITEWVSREAFGYRGMPDSYYGRQIFESNDRFYVLQKDVHYFNRAVASQIPDPLPDMAHGKVGRKDVNILQYAIIHAISGSKFRDMKTISGPEELCDMLGLKDPMQITKELYNTVTTKRLKQLSEAGILSPNNLPQYLEHAAEWIFQTADYANKTKRLGSGFSFPYLVDRQHHQGVKTEGKPPVEFLPFLHDAYLNFLRECPNYPKEGEYLMHDELLRHLISLNKFSIGLLVDASNDPTKDTLALSNIHNTVKQYRISFATIMKYFRLNPGILNRREPEESQQSILSFRQFADELRNNLAYPTKSQRIGFPHQVRNREA